MATSTTTPASTSASPSPAQAGFGNEFQLHDGENKTQVTYSLRKGGPVFVGESTSSPTLQYTGPEGSRSFEGSQILQQNTALGTLLTVTLNVVPDLRTLTFSMLLPQITKPSGPAGPGSSQTFETIAIKAEHHSSLTGALPPGGDTTYTAMKMHGIAKIVEVAD